MTAPIAVLFLILFGASFVTYLRRRDTLSRDVTLVFASVAGLFVVTGVAAVVGELPRIVVGAALALLLAQPLLTLRLAHRLRPVPKVVIGGATVAYLLTATPLLILPIEAFPALVLAAVIVFIAIDIAAAYYLVREAGRRIGSARTRLILAATASACMAMALGVVVLGAQIPALASVRSGAGSLIALLAALLFTFAFIPPRWVRRLWSAVATFRFGEQLAVGSSDESAVEVWARLAALARRSTGASAALILIGGETVTVEAADADDADAAQRLMSLQLCSLPAMRDGSRPVHDADGELATISQAAGAAFVSVLPFTFGGQGPGAVVILRDRPSLFASDDHAILRSLTGLASVFAERSEAVQQQSALARRLSETVKALERASQAKSDFLASMSHELRTPLSAIIGFSALMRDEPLSEGRRAIPDEWIEHVHRSGDHLLALINDVLDLTKIEAGRIELTRESFDLGAALAESVEGLRPLAERKRIEMHLDAEPGSIDADRGRLRQIVYNLLSNAIKFTPDGGRIDVEASWSGSDARISVTDTGVGIADDDLGRIFEEFSQVGDMKAREAGTGLGLALSRRLAEAHGGGIEVSSQLGRGSRFDVVLPDSRAEATREPVIPPVPTPGAAEATVLVIEDDPGAVRLLRTYLEAEGYGVVVATDGEAGIAAAREARPDAIVLDVLLPAIDGWEVLRRLKADAELRDIPVVVVTVVDERNVAMSLGAVDYFLKPVNPDALLARLSRYTFTTKVKQRRVRVLAIDDDASARELVASALRPQGFEVVTAASGREGIELAREDRPDLVICDLLMPDMDGYEVVNRLQADEETRGVMIIILTGQELTPADRDRLNGKVADVVGKDGDVRQALADWLRQAALAPGRPGAAPA